MTEYGVRNAVEFWFVEEKKVLIACLSLKEAYTISKNVPGMIKEAKLLYSEEEVKEAISKRLLLLADNLFNNGYEVIL